MFLSLNLGRLVIVLIIKAECSDTISLPVLDHSYTVSALCSWNARF